MSCSVMRWFGSGTNILVIRSLQSLLSCTSAGKLYIALTMRCSRKVMLVQMLRIRNTSILPERKKAAVHDTTHMDTHRRV